MGLDACFTPTTAIFGVCVNLPDIPCSIEEEAVLHEGSQQQSDEAGSCIPLDWGGKCSENC